MKRSADSVLGYAILGLLHQKPMSGYEVRKVFAETAMGNYSSSPGAIYPALRRLEANKLIAGKDESTTGGRERRIFRLSATGTAKLKKWILLPISAETLGSGAGEVMLRFAFLEQVHGREKCDTFLSDFRTALLDYTAKLEEFSRQNRERMPLSAWLALEQGIRGYQSMLEWTEYARQQYREPATRIAGPRSHISKGGR